uniref:Uncharacterized protein n=1 Tax=Arundo donax TaxID=35708 RepID=A0A0A9GX33_ARUDO
MLLCSRFQLGFGRLGGSRSNRARSGWQFTRFYPSCSTIK